MSAVTAKPCTKCGIELPLQAYYRNRKAKDGRQSQCKDCDKLRKVNRRRGKKSPPLRPIDIGELRLTRAFQDSRCAECNEPFSSLTGYSIDDMRDIETPNPDAFRLVCQRPPGCPDTLPQSFDQGAESLGELTAAAECVTGVLSLEKVREGRKHGPVREMALNALRLVLAAAALLMLLHFALPEFSLPFL